MGSARGSSLVKRAKQAHPKRKLIQADAQLIRPHNMASGHNLKDKLRIWMQHKEHPATGGKRKSSD